MSRSISARSSAETGRAVEISKPVPSALGNAVVQGMRCASETEESILLMLARSFVEGETLYARFVNAGAWLRNV